MLVGSLAATIAVIVTAGIVAPGVASANAVEQSQGSERD